MSARTELDREAARGRFLEACERHGLRPPEAIRFGRAARIGTYLELTAALDAGTLRARSEAEAARRVAHRLADWGCPPGLIRRATEAPGPALPRLLDEWVRGWQGASTVIVGPTGVGKSLAVVMALALVATDPELTGDHAHWVSGVTLSRARAEWPLGQGEPPVLTHARRAQVLVLDDPDWGRDEDAVRMLLVDRYESRRPVVLTSGHSVEGLSVRYGDSLVRRVVESSDGGSIVSLFFETDKGGKR